MIFQKFKTVSYYVGGRHQSATTNIVGDIQFNRKTGKEIKLIVGRCSLCDRKQSRTVSDNILTAERSGDSFRFLGKNGLNVTKKMAKNISKNPGRALEIGANVGSAFATTSPKAVLSSLPEVINFYHTGKGLYLGKFV